VVLLWKERRRALLSLLRTTSSRPFFLALRSLNQKNALNPSLPGKLEQKPTVWTECFLIDPNPRLASHLQGRLLQGTGLTHTTVRQDPTPERSAVPGSQCCLAAVEKIQQVRGASRPASGRAG